MTRKKSCSKVLIEENLDTYDIKRINPPTPAPHIIDKKSIVLLPDGEPSIQNVPVDQHSVINEKRVRKFKLFGKNFSDSIEMMLIH